MLIDYKFYENKELIIVYKLSIFLIETNQIFYQSLEIL